MLQEKTRIKTTGLTNDFNNKSWNVMSMIRIFMIKRTSLACMLYGSSEFYIYLIVSVTLIEVSVMLNEHI